MAARIQVVQRIEDDGKRAEPINIELGIFDVGVMRLNLYIRIEFTGGLSSNLRMVSSGNV